MRLNHCSQFSVTKSWMTILFFWQSWKHQQHIKGCWAGAFLFSKLMQWQTWDDYPSAITRIQCSVKQSGAKKKFLQEYKQLVSYWPKRKNNHLMLIILQKDEYLSLLQSFMHFPIKNTLLGFSEILLTSQWNPTNLTTFAFCMCQKPGPHEWCWCQDQLPNQAVTNSFWIGAV